MIPGSPTRYRRIADGLALRIASGEWRMGERLPSIRSLAESEGVSVATAVEAYLRLEAEGWVEARARSGFFVAARPGVQADEPGPTVVRGSRARRVAVASEVGQRLEAA